MESVLEAIGCIFCLYVHELTLCDKPILGYALFSETITLHYVVGCSIIIVGVLMSSAP